VLEIASLQDAEYNAITIMAQGSINKWVNNPPALARP
jgi:hypothetical protein